MGDQAARQKRYREAQKAKGLKQVLLWARPEDIPLLKEAARSPHALARMQREVRASVVEEVSRDVRKREIVNLRKKQRRDLLAQARCTVKLLRGGDNEASPIGVKIRPEPTEHLKTLMRRNLWTYDPIIALWRMPWMHERYASSMAMCRELERSGYVVEYFGRR